jgi:isopentenyldiphosphate isomerase
MDKNRGVIMDQHTSKVEQLQSYFGLEKVKQTALFVGSGVSIDAEMPSWENLKQKMENVLKARGHDVNGLDVFQIAKQMKKNYADELRELLRDCFRDPNIYPGELDKAIAAIRPLLNFVITTNYDKLLETAFRETPSGIDPHVVTSLEEAWELMRQGRFFIYKVHGDIDGLHDVAFTYPGFAQRIYKDIFNFLKTCRVAFIGYGFEDPIIEYFRTTIDQYDKSWTQSSLALLKEGPIADSLTADGVKVITFKDFNEQKRVLIDYAKRLEDAVATLNKVKKGLLVPDKTLSEAPLYSGLSSKICGAIDKVLILEHNWGCGWDSKQLVYNEKDNLVIPHEVAAIIQRLGVHVKRPWWGKYAYGGLIAPLTERSGTILVAQTNWRDYKVCHDNLDNPNIVKNSTLRERYWQYDVRGKFSDFNSLPHVICAHLAVTTKDNRLLLLRRGQNVMNWPGAWCPTMEGQASAGNGLELNESCKVEKEKGQIGRPVDKTVWDTSCRELWEELGIPNESISEIRIYAVVTGWDVSDAALIGVARLELSSKETLDRLEASEDKAEFARNTNGDVVYDWVDLNVTDIARLVRSEFYDVAGEERDRWHFSAKARIFAVAADMVYREFATWRNWEAVIN